MWMLKTNFAKGPALGLALLLATTGLAGCGDDDDDGGSVQSSSLSDPQVLGILAAVNQGEVSYSQKGMTSAADEKVRSFAAEMVDLHTAALMRVATVAGTTGLGSAESNVSAKLMSDEKAAEADLDQQTAGDAEYDLHFMCGEVRLHRGALDTIDQSLSPSAKNQVVRDEVTAERPVVAQHLQEAEALVVELGTRAGVDTSGSATAGSICKDRGGIG